MAGNKVLGDFGEAEAVAHLENEGYIILKKNFRCKLGEIDIIAADGDTLAFIEVKTRSTEKYGKPGEFVNYKKQNKIIKTALQYIVLNNLTDWMSRFDIVEVLVDKDDKVKSISLLKDAFSYSGRLGY